MPRATTPDGIEIEYDVQAFYDDDPPLVLIAGLGSQMLFFEDEFVQGLIDRAFRVVRMDNRDSGLSTVWDDTVELADLLANSDAIGPYTLGEMAGDVVAVLDDAGIDAAHVLGVSLGGMVAQTLAIEHPGRVASLTLLSSTSGAADVGQPSPEALAVLLEPLSDPDDRDAVVESSVRAREVWATPAHWDEDWARQHFGAAFDRANHPGAMARQMAAVLTAPDREDQLRELDVPALVLHGTDDRLIALDGGTRLAALIPGAELVELDGMGHDLPPHYWAPVIEAVTQLAVRSAG